MRPDKILVVDDEAPIRMLLQETLEEAGYSVETAKDGQAAWERFQEETFDIIFTDLKMPHMGGVDLFRKVKEVSPSTMVIVLTGHATLNSAIEALHSGCDEFLMKPLPSIKLVLHAVNRCVSRRNTLLRVASLKRISDARGEVLNIAWEELSKNAFELEECVDRITEYIASGEIEKATPFLDDMKESVGHMTRMLGTLDQAREILKDKPEKEQGMTNVQSQ